MKARRFVFLNILVQILNQMGRKKEIEKYDKMLQKHIDHQDYIKVYRTIFGEDENLQGFILAMSSDFMLLQLSGDFILDGYAIIRKDDFDSIRCNKYDKTQKKILAVEGILANELGIKESISLDSWNSIIQDLKVNDFHIIIEQLHKNCLGFEIGPIKSISKNKVVITNYDPTGKLDEKPTTIKFKTIKTIKFGDRYSTIFRKYLK